MSLVWGNRDDDLALKQQWQKTEAASTIRFQCGHCGSDAGPSRQYHTNVNASGSPGGMRILICPTCNRPTFFDVDNRQTPGPQILNDVPGITNQSVREAYREARDCMSVSAYTASVLVCRKLVLDVAEDLRKRELERIISEGKDTHALSKPFTQFKTSARWLAGSGFIPQQSKAAFERLVEVCGDITHEGHLATVDLATWTLTLIEQLLRLAYEFPFTTAPLHPDISTVTTESDPEP